MRSNARPKRDLSLQPSCINAPPSLSPALLFDGICNLDWYEAAFIPHPLQRPRVPPRKTFEKRSVRASRGAEKFTIQHGVTGHRGYATARHFSYGGRSRRKFVSFRIMDVAFLLRQLFRLINGLGIAWNWLKIYKLTKVSKKIVGYGSFLFFLYLE